MKKVNNVIRIPTSLSGNFFRYWFMFLQPFHKLTSREIDVITSLVKHRYELSKVIKDADLLERVTMSEDIKRKVREECNITLPHFQVIMGKLRKNQVIIDNKINQKFLPNIEEENGYFKLLLLFELQ
jgi:hypothetical protein